MKLLDHVEQFKGGYRLRSHLRKDDFADLCRMMGKHGFRYTGKDASGYGIFRPTDETPKVCPLCKRPLGKVQH